MHAMLRANEQAKPSDQSESISFPKVTPIVEFPISEDIPKEYLSGP